MRLTCRHYDTRRGGRRSALFVLSLAAVSCVADPVSPPQSPPSLEHLTIESEIYGVSDPAEGYLWVQAHASDSSFRVRDDAAFPLHVSSTSGDRETAWFRRRLCGPDRNFGWWLCDEIVIMMHDGHSPRDVYPGIQRIRGRLKRVSATERFAGVKLFGTSLDAAIWALQRGPHIRYAEYNLVGFQGVEGVSPSDVAARGLGASLRVDVTSPIIGNGILEVAWRDTVTFEYVQPDGSLLTARAIVPANAK